MADAASGAEPYQFFAPLPPAAYQALKADIARRGVLVPVEVDERGAILDGHHRLRAWRELAEEGSSSLRRRPSPGTAWPTGRSASKC